MLSHLNVTLLEEYKKGLFSIQDCAGMVVAHSLDVKEDMKVLDMCAAPGGKSMHTSELMNNSGDIVSCDIYTKKLEIMNFRMKQLGINNIMTKKLDGTIFNECYMNTFDRIICGVQCSGLGVIRRKPEILIYYSNEKIEELKKVQRQILENGIRYLKKGGVLIYSTCTINKEENEDIVYSILKEHEDIKLNEINLPFEFDYDKAKAKEGILNISGDKNNIDSFFIAKLTKI